MKKFHLILALAIVALPLQAATSNDYQQVEETFGGQTYSYMQNLRKIALFGPAEQFAIGNTLALQCHVEMMPPMVAEWAALYAHELQETSATVQSAEQMTTNLPAKIAAAQQVADHIYKHWLAPLLAESTKVR